MYSSRLDLQLCTLEYTLEYLLHHCHENMMNACELLLMRARARRAYCKKCRVHIALERVGRSDIPVLIPVPGGAHNFAHIHVLNLVHVLIDF